MITSSTALPSIVLLPAADLNCRTSCYSKTRHNTLQQLMYRYCTTHNNTCGRSNTTIADLHNGQYKHPAFSKGSWQVIRTIATELLNGHMHLSVPLTLTHHTTPRHKACAQLAYQQLKPSWLQTFATQPLIPSPHLTLTRALPLPIYTMNARRASS